MNARIPPFGFAPETSLGTIVGTMPQAVGYPANKDRSRHLRKLVAFLIVVFLTNLLFVSSVRGQEKKQIPVSKINRIMRSTAVKVRSLPTEMIATGILVKVPGMEKERLFITNKHVLQDAESLLITIPSIDTGFHIVDTLVRTIHLYNDSHDSLFVIPDNNLDLASLFVAKELISSGKKVSWSALPTSYYIPTEALFEGQEIIYYGYPTGRTINLYAPLLRDGVIAGVDTIKTRIFLDADAFGGSSGSPVYLNLYNSNNLSYYNRTQKVLVGVIAGYVYYEHPIRDTTTNTIIWIQRENTGLAVVIPAQEIVDLSEKALRSKKRK